MKSCFNVAFISAVFLILWAPEGFSIKCHTCHSAVSWDDCMKNSKIFDCEEAYAGIPATDLVCLTVVQSKLRTWDQQEFTYSKYCSPKETCDNAKCKKQMLQRVDYNTTKAVYCNVKCCPEDRCNVERLALAEEFGEFSKAEAPLSSCLYVMTLALVCFILENN
ncbi:hypothetical protein ACROYT_G007616 [Oculina patagonica]